MHNAQLNADLPTPTHLSSSLHIKPKISERYGKELGDSQYGPVTMIVPPASGHQVRRIPWVQMDTFNKIIGILCGLKFFALNIFCGK